MFMILSLHALQNLLLQAEATKSESVYQFTSDLRSQVVALLHRARELRDTIESPSYMEGNLTSDAILKVSGFHCMGSLLQFSQGLRGCSLSCTC